MTEPPQAEAPKPLAEVTGSPAEAPEAPSAPEVDESPWPTEPTWAASEDAAPPQAPTPDAGNNDGDRKARNPRSHPSRASAAVTAATPDGAATVAAMNPALDAEAAALAVWGEALVQLRTVLPGRVIAFESASDAQGRPRQVPSLGLDALDDPEGLGGDG